MVKAIDGANSAPVYVMPEPQDVQKLINTSQQIVNIAHGYSNAFDALNDNFIRLTSIVENLHDKYCLDENGQPIDFAEEKQRLEEEKQLIEEESKIREAEHQEHLKYIEKCQREHVETQQFIERSREEGIETDKRLEKLKVQQAPVVHIKKEKQHREKDHKEIISKASSLIQMSFCTRFWSWIRNFWK